MRSNTDISFRVIEKRFIQSLQPPHAQEINFKIKLRTYLELSFGKSKIAMKINFYRRVKHHVRVCQDVNAILFCQYFF